MLRKFVEQRLHGRFTTGGGDGTVGGINPKSVPKLVCFVWCAKCQQDLRLCAEALQSVIYEAADGKAVNVPSTQDVLVRNWLSVQLYAPANNTSGRANRDSLFQAYLENLKNLSPESTIENLSEMVENLSEMAAVESLSGEDSKQIDLVAQLSEQCVRRKIWRFLEECERASKSEEMVMEEVSITINDKLSVLGEKIQVDLLSFCGQRDIFKKLEGLQQKGEGLEWTCSTLADFYEDRDVAYSRAHV